MTRTRLPLACAFVIAVTAAHAHSWYERGCCDDQDCKPVEEGRVQERPDGVHVTGWSDVLQEGDPKLRWSRDDQDHVCENSNRLICVYRKRKTM